MGVAQGIDLVADAPSQAEPGTLCIRTASLSDLDPPLTIEDIFDECEIFYRYPIPPGSETEQLLKTVEVQEHGQDSFTIRIVLDGKKLDAIGKGRGDGGDMLRGWRHVVVDRQSWKISSTWYLDPAGGGAWLDEVADCKVAACHSVLYAMQDPLHFEICWDSRGVRESSTAVRGKQVAAVFKSCQKAKHARVQVACNVASLKVPGTVSNVSSPIPADVTYEDLFSSMVSVLQRHAGSDTFCTTVDVAGISTGTRDAVVGTADSEQCVRAEESLSISRKRKIRSDVRFSRETGEITLLETAVTENGHVAQPAWSRVQHCVLHRGPLRVESWGESDDGVHVTKAVAARRWQEWVNAALDSLSFMSSLDTFVAARTL